MSKSPVIILSFANQLDGYLSNLKLESAALNKALSNLHQQGIVEVYREESATANLLFDAFSNYRTRAIIFHYAGHANGERIYLEDNTGEAAGLAALLAQMPNLQLVFLNGCATMGQVKTLFNNGIKAVIATAVPIDDQKARLFSEKFYIMLAAGASIKIAFESATAYIKLTFGGEFAAAIFRKDEIANFDDNNQMPWGLFLNTEKDPEVLLKWSLPTQAAPQVARPTEEYIVNAYLLSVMSSMLDYDQELEKVIYDTNGELKDDREIFAAIIEHFPWIIGVQLRLLGTKDDNLDSPSVERFKQLISAYSVTMQFIYFVALSQLWEECRQQKITVASLHANLNFINPQDFFYLDYNQLFLDAVDSLRKANCTLFIKELDVFVNNLHDTQHELFAAVQHLQIAKQRINQQEIDKLNIIQTCADAEYALAIFLGELAFFVNYDLLTVRNIQVVNFRYGEARFEHFIGKLSAKVGDLTVGATNNKAIKPRNFPNFLNNASVVLAKNIQDPNTYLNLSPFIVDKNAFGVSMTEDKASAQQLYIYAYREEAEYKYFSTLHSIYKVQERALDQFLTNEGAVVESESEDSRSSRLRNKLLNRLKRNATEVVEEAVQSPYAVLKHQFQIFAQDLS